MGCTPPLPGSLVAWYQGKSEFGPRALGNRSLLGDPRRANMREIINQKIKCREWFRPFAPVVLKEKAQDWFEMDFESPLMLFISQVKKPTEIPAVMLQMLAISLMITLDMHYTLLVGFQQSYHLLPIGGGILSDRLFDDVTLMASRTFLVGVKIASPIIAVGIVVNILLCMLARAVPQMNVFMESFGIRLLIGIMLMGSVINMAALEIANYLHQLPDDFVTVVRLLGLGG